MATQAGTSSIQVKSQATVPTTVEQILSCKYSQFKIFDVPVQIVILVGIIRNMNIDLCEFTCEIQDTTGSITGTIILETEAEVAPKVSQIRENSYAKVFGSVRNNQDGAKYIHIVKMFPVVDLNVLSHHLLQSACFTLEAEAERHKQIASANTTGAALADAVMDTGTVTEERHQTPLTALQKLVFDIVRSEHSDYGITKRSVLRQFPSYQGIDVNQALDYLINEGMIYHSIDQEHLKVVEY